MTRADRWLVVASVIVLFFTIVFLLVRVDTLTQDRNYWEDTARRQGVSYGTR